MFEEVSKIEVSPTVAGISELVDEKLQRNVNELTRTDASGLLKTLQVLDLPEGDS